MVSSSSSTRALNLNTRKIPPSFQVSQLFPMSHLEEGDYRILEASSKNFVVHTADKDGENLMLQVKEPDRNMPDQFGREARFRSRTVHSEL